MAEPAVPSGFIQLPIWLFLAVWGVVWSTVTGLALYIWHALDKRVGGLENSEKEKVGARTNDPAWKKVEDRITDLEREELKWLRDEIQNPMLSVNQHLRMCSSVTATFKEIIGGEVQHIYKQLDELKQESRLDVQELKAGQAKVWEKLDELVRNGNKK